MFDKWWPAPARCARRVSRPAAQPAAILLALARLQLLCLALSSGDPRGATARGRAVMEGFVSVSAALLARNRQGAAVFARRDATGDWVARLAALARAAGVPLRRVDAATIGRYAAGSSPSPGRGASYHSAPCSPDRARSSRCSTAWKTPTPSATPSGRSTRPASTG